MKCGPISRGSIRDLIYLIFGAASATGPTTERGFITRWDVDPESGPVPGLEVYNFLPRTPWHILGPSRGMVVPASKKRKKKTHQNSSTTGVSFWPTETAPPGLGPSRSGMFGRGISEFWVVFLSGGRGRHFESDMINALVVHGEMSFLRVERVGLSQKSWVF